MSDQKVAVVTGAAWGLGEQICQQLASIGYRVEEVDKAFGHDVADASGFPVFDRVDVLVNCAGVNRIAWLEDLTESNWDEVMDTNAKGIAAMTQALLPQLRASGGTVLNIVSNASHVPMRGSAAYNASKGAAAILSKQMARELISDGITVFAISPNKLADTGMSNDIDVQVQQTRGWTAQQAREYQLAGLLTGKETDPDKLAEFIAFLLYSKERHEMLAGCDLQYGL